ncbi:mitochondrial amidoxime-reducing component 1-like [Solea senegalensis]|uniref:Mitochondrial amidoxime-reducing component 1-like n=1 Tax=Solea senegalensis TaxID=28829 RepID=A0AAV6S2N8_SOLSE|nr:mitochondrial amidoxime-reducing component 1-like [Solea senegalensis]
MEVKTQVVNALAENKRSALLVLGAGVGAAALLGFGLAFKYPRKPEKLLRVGVRESSECRAGGMSQVWTQAWTAARQHLEDQDHQPQAQLTGREQRQALQPQDHLDLQGNFRYSTAMSSPVTSINTKMKEGHAYIHTSMCMYGLTLTLTVRFPRWGELWNQSTAMDPLAHVVETLAGGDGGQTHDLPLLLSLCCRVYRGESQGRDCGDEVSRWLTRYFGVNQTFRLVHFELQMKGRQSPEPLFSPYERLGVHGRRTCDAVVGGLCSQSEHDCKAFAEDSWDEIQIGNVRLQRVMSCGRCLFTTVDPDTGTFHRKEPYQTLKSYRLCDPSEKHIYKSSPLFGQLHTVKKTGMVQVGDVVYTVSCKCHSQTKKHDAGGEISSRENAVL